MLSATVVGRLGRDAEVRSTSNGGSIASFSVGSDHGFGERKITTWVTVSVFGKDVEFAGKLVKGDRVAVSGASYLRKWESNGKSGADYSIDAHRVEKLWDAKPEDGGERGPSRRSRPDARGEPQDDDLEIPF